MDTILTTTHGKYDHTIAKPNVFVRFINWCARQEEKRLLWTGIILPVQACILAPITFIVAMFAGIHFALFIPVMAVLVFTFITNLAALPTKITIPVFVLGVLVDVGVMVAAGLM